MTMLKSTQFTTPEKIGAELNKASVLVEALPYIKKYHEKIIVVKFGGNAMDSMEHVIEDIVLLKRIGLLPVVVHGGGPDIDKELVKKGAVPKFINGLRYTDSETVKIVEEVFLRINAEIVSRIRAHGAKAVNARGSIKVRKKSEKFGFVGEITSVNRARLLRTIKSRFIPVISPLGIGQGGEKYNINADTAAAHIAVALKAEKLTILTNVDGVNIGGKLLSHINFRTAKSEIKRGNISKGMIPKVEACIYAVQKKCPKAHLINGLIPHSILLEIFTDKGIGTEIVYKNGDAE